MREPSWPTFSVCGGSYRAVGPEQAGAKPPVPGLDLERDGPGSAGCSTVDWSGWSRERWSWSTARWARSSRIAGPVGLPERDPAVFRRDGQAIDELATVVVKVLEDSVASRFGRNHLPKPEQVSELSGTARRITATSQAVVTDHLDKALQRRMVIAVPDDTVGLLLSGQWERNST